MVSSKQDVPYHMREDSDEEPLEEDANSEGSSRISVDQEVQKQQEGVVARRKARLGKVELDPKIRMPSRSS